MVPEDAEGEEYEWKMGLVEANVYRLTDERWTWSISYVRPGGRTEELVEYNPVEPSLDAAVVTIEQELIRLTRALLECLPPGVVP